MRVEGVEACLVLAYEWGSIVIPGECGPHLNEVYVSQANLGEKGDGTSVRTGLKISYTEIRCTIQIMYSGAKGEWCMHAPFRHFLPWHTGAYSKISRDGHITYSVRTHPSLL